MKDLSLLDIGYSKLRFFIKNFSVWRKIKYIVDRHTLITLYQHYNVLYYKAQCLDLTKKCEALEQELESIKKRCT